MWEAEYGCIRPLLFLSSLSPSLIPFLLPASLRVSSPASLCFSFNPSIFAKASADVTRLSEPVAWVGSKKDSLMSPTRPSLQEPKQFDLFFYSVCFPYLFYFPCFSLISMTTSKQDSGLDAALPAGLTSLQCTNTRTHHTQTNYFGTKQSCGRQRKGKRKLCCCCCCSVC